MRAATGTVGSFLRPHAAWSPVGDLDTVRRWRILRSCTLGEESPAGEGSAPMDVQRTNGADPAFVRGVLFRTVGGRSSLPCRSRANQVRSWIVLLIGRAIPSRHLIRNCAAAKAAFSLVIVLIM